MNFLASEINPLIEDIIANTFIYSPDKGLADLQISQEHNELLGGSCIKIQFNFMDQNSVNAQIDTTLVQSVCHSHLSKLL